MKRYAKFVRLMSALSALTALWALTAAQARAEEAAPPERIESTVRVFGLFQPDRVDDLKAAVAEIDGLELKSVDYETGEAVFVCDAKLVNHLPPEQVAERLDQLLRGPTHGTFGVRPRSTIPRDKLELVEIGVVGLDCKACSFAAYKIVQRIDGVERATASFREGRVTALIDPARTSRAALEEALKQRTVTLKGE